MHSKFVKKSIVDLNCWVGQVPCRSPHDDIGPPLNDKLGFPHRIASVSPCLTTSHTTQCTWHLAGLHQNIWNNTGSDCKCTPVIVIIVMVLQGSCLFISYADWCKAAVMTGCRILSRVINCNRYTCNSCNQPTMRVFKPRILLQFTFSNDLVINLNTKIYHTVNRLRSFLSSCYPVIWSFDNSVDWSYGQ